MFGLIVPVHSAYTYWQVLFGVQTFLSRSGANMADVFNAYHKWLGIPAKEQPPNHYRLLGVELFESDPDV